MKNRKKSGFTLVELMVVAAIIAILAAIIIPLLTQNRVAAVAAEGQNISGALINAAKAQYARTGDYPATVGDLDDDDLKADAYNTKYWTVDDTINLGAKDATTITLSCSDDDLSGDLTLETDNTWTGDGDFDSITE